MQEINDRPYSQKELKNLRQNYKKSKGLSDNKAFHSECNHIYFVKKNSKKEKAILERPDLLGNCSVCWNLSNENKDDYILRMVNDYSNLFKEENFLDITLLDLEVQYYNWLYKCS